MCCLLPGRLEQITIERDSQKIYVNTILQQSVSLYTYKQYKLCIQKKKNFWPVLLNIKNFFCNHLFRYLRPQGTFWILLTLRYHFYTLDLQVPFKCLRYLVTFWIPWSRLLTNVLCLPDRLICMGVPDLPKKY